MANLIKAPTATVQTQGNECIIKLEISLNVNVNGQEQKQELQLESNKEIDWVLPDFDSSSKLKFGKENT
jgi:hypothetical protein